MLKNKLLSAMGGSEPTDPYFNYTTLLLHGDGTNGAQNNTFVDSSPNNFTITRNGNVTQGAFSPFLKEPGKWGVSFDGSGDYLTAPGNAAFAFGTGDFTVECWLNASVSSYNTIFATATGGSVGAWFGLYDPNGAPYLYDATGGNSGQSSIGTVNGTWNHIAYTRQGTTLRIFVNGVVGFSGTSTTNFTVGGCYVGVSAYGSLAFNGTISNLRIVKGTALYTSNFTPPTAPLTAVAGTSLLCCQDNRFKDNSANNFTLTPYGDVALTPFSPFANSAAWSASVNGGSGYFDGGGDYLTPSADPLNFGTGAFTIEAWIYLTGTPSGNLGNAIIGGSVDSASRIFFGVSRSGVTSGKLTVEQYGVGVIVTSSTAIALNTWYHAAVSRDSSGNYRLFVNGTQEASNSNSNSVGTGGAYIGSASTGGGTANNPFQGYIANLRTVTGTAVYTASFTPPTAPVTAITNTSLLLNFTNAGIYDNTGMNNLETVGNAQVSTAQAKFGTGSAQFEGTNSYLLTSAISFPGDFTVETWAKINVYQLGPILQIGNYADGVWLRSTSGTECAINGVFITIPNYTTVFPLNTWHHVAITRASNVCRLFVNGIQIGSSITVSGIVNAANILTRLGSSAHAGNEYFNGWLDEYRVTKGVARYTANFTPPTQAFPNK